MKNILASSAILAGLVSAPSVIASSLDVDLNNDTLYIQYNATDDQTDLGLAGAVMLTDDNGNAFSFTARTQGALASKSNIRGGFGGRFYHFDPDGGDSFQSLGLGGFIDITPPELSDFTFGLELYYSPSITTTDDIDNITDMTFTLSYQLFENASAYFGLRYLEAEIDEFDIEIDDGAHIGFTLQF